MDEFKEYLIQHQNELVGTKQELSTWYNELPEAEVRTRLAKLNVERCPNCKTWVDSLDLLAEDADGQSIPEDGFCSNCRKK